MGRVCMQDTFGISIPSETPYHPLSHCHAESRSLFLALPQVIRLESSHQSTFRLLQIAIRHGSRRHTPKSLLLRQVEFGRLVSLPGATRIERSAEHSSHLIRLFGLARVYSLEARLLCTEECSFPDGLGWHVRVRHMCALCRLPPGIRTDL